MFWLIAMLVWNFTFCEPSDEQLTGQGKMKSSCLTQRWPLKVRKRYKGHCFGSPLPGGGGGGDSIYKKGGDARREF